MLSLNRQCLGQQTDGTQLRWQREPELCIAITGVNIYELSSLNSGLIPRPGGSAWEQGFTSCTHTPSAFVLLQHMVYFRSDNWVTTTATRELCQLRRAWESPEPSIYRLSLSFNFLFKDGCLCFCFTKETAKLWQAFHLSYGGLISSASIIYSLLSLPTITFHYS